MIRFLLLVAFIGHSLVVVAVEADEASSKLQPHPDPVMEKLIQRIEDQERRYDRMEVTLQRTTEYLNKKWTIPKSVETIRTVRQPELFFAERNRVDHILDGSKRTDRSVAFYNGKTTTAIEYNNSVNVLHYRYEPAFVLPPHTWAMFHLQVDFPLSVYLRGTQAMQAFRKVRQLPVRTNLYFGVNLAESESLGEVDFEGLKCDKVRVLQRSREKSPPSIRLFWLAKKHNYVCVRSQALVTIKGVDYVLAESKINAFRELDEGLFIPQKISVKRYDYQALTEGEKTVDSKYTLLVKSANTSPMYSSEELAPDVPEDLPKYEISADQRLINSPHHPTPTGKPPSTNLDNITVAIRKAEKKHQNIDLSLFEDLRQLRRKNSAIGGGISSTRWSKTESRTIGSQGRFFHFEDEINSMGDGINRRYQKTILYDGKVAQSASASKGEDSNKLKITSVVVSFEEEPNLDIVRPHMMLFRILRDHRPLSKVVGTNWYDHTMRSTVNVVYEGDELIDGELCHKIRRDVVTKKNQVYVQQFIWIAPKKNYLPIRTEWKDRAKSLSLPDRIHVVTSLKEVAPSVWMPMEARSATFQWFAASGMTEGRLVHQWQRDMMVKNVSLSPEVDDKLFSELTVPAGTEIKIRGADGKRLGSIIQPKEGPIEVSGEQINELKGE